MTENRVRMVGKSPSLFGSSDKEDYLVAKLSFSSYGIGSG